MNRFKGIILALLLGSFLSFGQTLPSPAQRGTADLQAKADLLVEKIEFKATPVPGKGTDLQILYTIYNNSSVPIRNCPTAAGKAMWNSHPKTAYTFETIIGYRDYPNGVYKTLDTVGWDLEGHCRFTFMAAQLVPAGCRRQYIIRADHNNWIDESNENNNDKTAIWPLLGVALPKQK
jgi:hypothetical protein